MVFIHCHEGRPQWCTWALPTREPSVSSKLLHSFLAHFLYRIFFFRLYSTSFDLLSSFLAVFPMDTLHVNQGSHVSLFTNIFCICKSVLNGAGQWHNKASSCLNASHSVSCYSKYTRSSLEDVSDTTHCEGFDNQTRHPQVSINQWKMDTSEKGLVSHWSKSLQIRGNSSQSTGDCPDNKFLSWVGFQISS